MIIAIDIGLKGGICIRDGFKISVCKMPLNKSGTDFKRVAAILKNLIDHKPIVVFEKLRGIYKTSKKSTWSLAKQAGTLIGICLALSIYFLEVEPKKWQAFIFNGVEVKKRLSRLEPGKMVNDTKEMAAEAFLKLFPNSQHLATVGKKLHDGIIDAILISEWYRKTQIKPKNKKI